MRVFAGDWLVSRDDQHAQLVDVEKFRRFRFGGAGHAGQLVIEPEIILNGNGGVGLRLPLDLDAFLGFDGLVQAIAPAASGHQASGVLIDDDHLVLLNDVLHVLQIEAIGLEKLRDAMDLLRLGLKVSLQLGFHLQPFLEWLRAGVDFMKR